MRYPRSIEWKKPEPLHSAIYSSTFNFLPLSTRPSSGVVARELTFMKYPYEKDNLYQVLERLSSS